MATLPISFLFSIVLLLLFHSTRSTTPVCDKRYCGIPEQGTPFEFPFRLKEGNDNQSDRCGYKGFEVFCNDRNQALLTLSKAREFVVNYISLENQMVWINDPNECLPRRFLQNIDLKDSPFQWDRSYYKNNFENFTFINCTIISGKPSFDGLHPIPCLSNDKYSIMYTLDPPINSLNQSCHEIGFALVPVKDLSRQPQVISEGIYSDLVLHWNKPLCNCEPGQYCGFLTDTGDEVTCYNYNNNNFDPQGGNPSPSRNRSVYFFPIAWGISGLLFFLWVILSVCKGRRNNQQPQTNVVSSNLDPPWFVLGLDRSRIEKYPKIQLAESGQLPKSIDNVCTICLSEYKPKETLRSMPQCNHHFHVDCIDAWLKINATCPLCRNLPEGSALVISSLPRSTISDQPSLS